MRRTLNKYWQLTEQQRQIIYNLRQSILLYKVAPSRMAQNLSELYETWSDKVGEEAVLLAERQVTLFVINRSWMDFLDYLSYIRESIHLVSFAKEVPVFEYNKRAIAGFEQMTKEMEQEILDILSTAKITREGIDMEKAGLKVPTSTWTYLVDDNPTQIGLQSIILNPMAIVFSFPFYMIMLVYYKLKIKSKKLL